MRISQVHSTNIFRRIPFSRRLTRRQKKSERVVVSLLSPSPVEKVDSRYLSFSIDISVLAGGFWWEGSEGVRNGLGTSRVAPLNLRSKKLDAFVVSLGSSYLRVGGSEADKIHYFTGDDEPDSLVLTEHMWDELHAFIRRNDLKFMFTFKYGLFKRSEHGEWKGTEIQRLLEYTRERNYNIDVCELGNELNAYWAFHGLRSQPRAASLARDYYSFAQLVRANLPDTKVCGPGSAFWPRLGETIRPFSNITRKFLECLRTELDIVDWHYYPFQSSRSPVRTRSANIKNVLLPNSFEDYAKYCLKLREWRDLFQPNAELWTGETGSAQCGGQARISDRFASCFWWADQLGRGALLGQKVMIRQSLVGGEYGLIDRLTMKPRPDYWVSWLWVNLMGSNVYAVDVNNEMIRAYCHTHPKGKKRTLLLINLSPDKKSISCAGFGSPKRRYEITAKKLTSKKIRINGVKPGLQNGLMRLSDIPRISNEPSLKPYSINFWCFGS